MDRRRLYRDSGGWIYAVQEDGDPLVKIGFTYATPHKRLGGLRREYRLNDLPYFIEQWVHHLLLPQWIQGEWFYLHMNQAILETLVQEVTQQVWYQCARESYKELLTAEQRICAMQCCYVN